MTSMFQNKKVRLRMMQIDGFTAHAFTYRHTNSQLITYQLLPLS